MVHRSCLMQSILHHCSFSHSGSNCPYSSPVLCFEKAPSANKHRRKLTNPRWAHADGLRTDLGSLRCPSRISFLQGNSPSCQGAVLRAPSLPGCSLHTAPRACLLQAWCPCGNLGRARLGSAPPQIGCSAVDLYRSPAKPDNEAGRGHRGKGYEGSIYKFVLVQFNL